MGMPLVTIITATTGNPLLKDNVVSVNKQTYNNIQHLIVCDGVEREANTRLFLKQTNSFCDLIVLPYPTGIEQYNGHRIYGAATYICKGDYVIFLDEDNWLEENHVESLVASIKPNSWAYALRKITNMDGDYICNDDCESLGNWLSVVNDYFVDVNCFFLPKKVALGLSPVWYRRARNPNEQPEVDRLMTHLLMLEKEKGLEAICSGLYTVNYRAGNRADSVKPEFFLQGNEIMKRKYFKEENFPWRKK